MFLVFKKNLSIMIKKRFMINIRSIECEYYSDDQLLWWQN